MTTLAADLPRTYELSDIAEYGVIADDIIYEGSAVGDNGAGYARPLVGGDAFLGFAERKADNSDGSAGAINVQVNRKGNVKLSVSGAVITDVTQPVYATDDNTFVFNPVGASFIGFVRAFVSSGVVIVAYDVDAYTDPYGNYTVKETLSTNKTFDSEDSGKLFWVDTDAITLTLPAVATPVLAKIVNGGAFGTIAVTISPDSGDSLEGPNITAADDKDLINTKATANRGDFAVLGFVDAAGYAVTELVGIWARQA